MSTGQPGRVKTVIIIHEGGQPRGVVTAVVACAKPAGSGPRRLIFTGAVQIEPVTRSHIEEVILPLVDQILDECLQIPKPSYDVSFDNLGAAAACDLALRVSGFSADLSVFIALLSASLGLPVPESLTATGQINFTDGSIGLVSRIPEKIAAAEADPAITLFIHPRLDRDNSLEELAPREKARLEAAIATPRNALRLLAVPDVAEVLEVVFDEESIVLAGFRQGFFDTAPPQEQMSHVAGRCAGFLTNDNERRFWNALEGRLLTGEVPAAKQLLSARTRYQVDKKSYPRRFGLQLHQLVISLPPVIRRLKPLFPLLPTKERVCLSRLASETDYEDVEHLHDAARGKSLFLKEGQRTAAASDRTSSDEVNGSMSETLDAILSEISEETLSERFGQQIHSARMSFKLHSITTESHDDFFETLTAFFQHLHRHCNFTTCTVDEHVARSEAVALLERAFAQQGGAVAAERESRYGFHGGLRLVLDVVTTRFLAEVYEKWINMVLKSALDPLDSKQKSLLVDALMKRLAPGLPPDIIAMPLQGLSEKYDGLVRTHAKSMDAIRDFFRRM
jgi:hypothetical protein